MEQQLNGNAQTRKNNYVGIFIALIIAFIACDIWDSGDFWCRVLYQFRLNDSAFAKIIGLGTRYFDYSYSDEMLQLSDLLRAGFPGIILAAFPISACFAMYFHKKRAAIVLAAIGCTVSAAITVFTFIRIIGYTSDVLWGASRILGLAAHILVLLAAISDEKRKTIGIFLLSIGALALILTILMSFCDLYWDSRSGFRTSWSTERWEQDQKLLIPFFIQKREWYGTVLYIFPTDLDFPLSRGLLFLAMGFGSLMSFSGMEKNAFQSVSCPASVSAFPAYKIATNRSLVKMIFLGIITLGIYPAIISYYMCEDINLIASAHDGRRTMHPVAAGLLTAVTFGIYYFVWEHMLCNRIRDELDRRSIVYKFNASTFWLWGVLGTLILVGPFIFVHKYCKAMNYLAADYNERG